MLLSSTSTVQENRSEYSYKWHPGRRHSAEWILRPRTLTSKSDPQEVASHKRGRVSCRGLEETNRHRYIGMNATLSTCTPFTQDRASSSASGKHIRRQGNCEAKLLVGIHGSDIYTLCNGVTHSRNHPQKNRRSQLMTPGVLSPPSPITYREWICILYIPRLVLRAAIRIHALKAYSIKPPTIKFRSQRWILENGRSRASHFQQLTRHNARWHRCSFPNVVAFARGGAICVE